jgi:beta-N-acetylhexosaminidase
VCVGRIVEIIKMRKTMFNIIKKKIVIALMLMPFSISAFGDVSTCQQIADKQLCNKIGQMLIIGFGGFKQDENGKVLWDDKDNTQFKTSSLIAQHVANNHVGGVILYTRPFRDVKTGEFIRDRNIQTPKQVAKLNQDLQNYNTRMISDQNLEPLPLFISIDQEGGAIDRLPATLGFPVATLLPQALGAKEEVVLKKETAIKETYVYAKKLAKEISDANFNLNFAPTVDININPTNPIIGGKGRSFSADHKVVYDQAKQFIKAFNEYKISPVLKHFPGHGSSLGDTHVGLVDVTETYQKDKELYPYSKLIKDGYDGMIMTTHVINGQIDQTQCRSGSKTDHPTWCPGTMSKKTLTGLLRDELGFKGIIVSDDMTMGAITEEYDLRETLKKSINAGVDIFIVANNYEDQTNAMINTIAQLVKDGEIKRERIDESYDRIVAFKKKHLSH